MSHLPVLALTGIAVCVSLFAGKVARKAGFPSIIGYMLLGMVMGISVLNLFSEEIINGLSFITNIALGFIAFSIGSELSIRTLKRLGKSIVSIILFESFFAFILVFFAVLVVSGGNFPMAIVFGALAPASAPAGTVAVIQEYKARGKLTQALYAVVGFDDGLAIIIYGFAAAFAKTMVSSGSGGAGTGLLKSIAGSGFEILFSLVLGTILGFAYTYLLGKLKSADEIPTLSFGLIALTTGLAVHFHLSLILANMMIGFILANTQRQHSVTRTTHQLRSIMPLLFILFFFLAGAHLDVSVLPSLGLLGLVYILSRSLGKISGAFLGAQIGKADPRIRKYLGIGILSQAGVAIGLSLIVAQDFNKIGTPQALHIGSVVITTIAATCIIFEIIGPILARIALKKAGEIP